MARREEAPPENLGQPAEEVEPEAFGELIRYTVAGYLAGLMVGFVLDQLGFQRGVIGQWLVRTLSGEGESILEGIYAIRARLAGKVGSMAEAYGWGKLLGMVFPWRVDAVSRLAGVDVYGWRGFYIPYLYAMSDQIGASAAGLLFCAGAKAVGSLPAPAISDTA
jgi:hypothetical protein